MIAWSRTRIMFVGLALIVATNAVALIGVAYNRSGESESRLVFTERELNLPYRGWARSDNSGVSLRLQYRIAGSRRRESYPHVYGSYQGVDQDWLDKAKLEELGFDVSRPLDSPQARRYYDRDWEREVLLVLEFDGAAYAAELDGARQHLERQTKLLAANPGNEEFQRRRDSAQRELYAEQRINSRLFVIDAGRDAAALRAQYPDRGRYLVVVGRVRMMLREHDGKRSLRGWVSELGIDSIQVPYGYRHVFDVLLDEDRAANNSENTPRYQVTLAYGKRHEPWVVEASPLASDGTSR